MMALAGTGFRRSAPLFATAFASLTSRSSSSRAPFLSSSVVNRFKSSASNLQMSSTLAPDTSAVDLEKAYSTTHPAYEVMEKEVVTEYGAYCTLFKHKKSGAELLSVSCDDDNKVFCVTLRTPPDDSTGVPHILEHSVLCGSRKYTTKDPFVHLLKGSLQTFLNAFTYPDRTCYAVASQNEKDFYNLVNVYADAVYYPRAITDPKVLAQEGWHFELDDDGKLVYNGVVYNEMKGVYSSADSLLGRASQRSLFTDNTYRVDSGGDPVAIPDLSFEQFRDFHTKFYHPSNSRIFFAGDDDVYRRLELMDEYLNAFDASDSYKKESEIPYQKKSFKEQIRVVETYPAGADQPATHMFTINWLLNDEPLSVTEELTLEVLDHLLLGTTASTLRKAMMESGLGDAVTGGGLSSQLLQSTFSLGLKGVKPENMEKAEKLVVEALEKIAAEGFTDEDIESSLNTIEFSMREFNTGSFPRYLSFGLAANTKWLYGGSPSTGLRFEKPLAELKENIAKNKSKVFTDLIKSQLLENTHRSFVELKPSKTMEEEMLKEEEGRLAAIKEKLTEQQLATIVEETEELKKIQGTEDSAEDRSTIPQLELKDLKRESTEYPIEITKNEKGSGITVVRHELGSTSGIAYVTLAVDMSGLSLDEVPLLPLFTQLLTETGAGEYDAVGLSQKIGTHTGGVGTSTLITAVHPEGADEGAVESGENMLTKLVVKGKSTSAKVDELLSIFNLILTDARLDSQHKVIELLKEKRSRLESSIQGSGHSYANTRLKARYRVGGYIDEITGGLSYLDTVKALLKEAEDDWPSLLEKLEKVRSTLLDQSSCRSGMILDITGDKDVMKSIQPSIDNFLEILPGDKDAVDGTNFYNSVHPWVSEAKPHMESLAAIGDEGFVVPTQVSYVGKAGLIYEEGEHIPGSASVVSRFLRTGYLWDRVRVMGGAYGGFCVFSPFSGMISFLSYRDPNLEKTLDVYDASADALIEAVEAMEKDPGILETAIIGAIGDMDGALSQEQKGGTAFQRWLINESPEYRQKFREEILETKPSDFKDFANRLRVMKRPSVTVVSSKGAFETAAKAGKEMKLQEVF